MMAGMVTSGQDRITPLLERERELETLADAIASAGKGKGSLVLVEGPAGIGKTRLLAEVAEIADRDGFLVRLARGGEMERDMPFGVVRQLFEPLLQRASEEDRAEWLSGSARQALAALGAPDTGELQPATDPYAAINALYWLTSNLGTDRPLLLVVDDAHWGDGPSLRFATFLARRLADVPVVLLVGIRTGEAAEPTEVQSLRLEGISLQPRALSDASVHELITQRVGREPAREFSDACATATAGNPFLVMEILRELGGKADSLDRVAGEAIAKLAPENVARTVLFRLGRFGDDAIALARAIAVLGRAPQLRHAAELAGMDEDSARVLADQLRDAEVLAPGIPIEFVHPLVRQAIYHELPEGKRSAEHRRAAEILASTKAPPDEIVAHLLLCEPNGNPWIVARLDDAAESAIEGGAYDAAVTYLDRAMQEPAQDELSLLQKLGTALMQTDWFRSRQVFEELVHRATDLDMRITALRWLATSQMATGDLAGGAGSLDEVIAAIGDRDREVALGLEGELFFLTYASTGSNMRAAKRIEAVAAHLSGETSGERLARQALGMLRFVNCVPVEEVIDAILPAPDLPWRVGGADVGVAIAAPKVLAWCGRWDEARLLWQRWTASMEQEGRLLTISFGNSFLAEADRLAGRLHESEAQARTAWEIAQLQEGLSPFRWSAWMNLAATLIARGDVAGFEEVIGGLDLSAGPFEMPGNPWPLEIRALYHRERGDLDKAADDFLRLTDEMERFGRLNPSMPPHWRQEATEVLAALGRTGEAKRLITVAEQRAEVFGAPHAIGLTLRARAMIEPRSRAIALFLRSVEILEVSGPPHELARSLIALGAALRRGGERTDARAALGRALELAHRCGAGGLERRARDELAAAGARPRRAIQTGVGALTASELKAAKLAAGGLTNKEIAERLFVTLRTVETHLTHVYEKLAVGGRRDLAGALAVPTESL